jgi:hypothetical protein
MQENSVPGCSAGSVLPRLHAAAGITRVLPAAWDCFKHLRLPESCIALRSMLADCSGGSLICLLAQGALALYQIVEPVNMVFKEVELGSTTAHSALTKLVVYPKSEQRPVAVHSVVKHDMMSTMH